MHGTSGTTRPLWRRWVVVVTAGEVVGFSVPAVVGTASLGWAPSLSVPALLAAGAVEGAALGWSQAVAVGPWLPGFPRRRFAAATAAGAVVAYGLGLLPSTLGDAAAGWPGWALVVAGALVATALVASLGTAQWLVLRRLAASAWWWVPWTAAAWLVGLAVFGAVTTPLWAPGQGVAVVVAVGLLGGLAMAATAAAVTGGAAVRLVERASAPSDWAGRPRQRAERP